ncbi:hypothetical protein ATX55_11780 [Oenococcus oeni]|nr:hypothetical protein ATX55_11780 [Oenococcus oeni]
MLQYLDGYSFKFDLNYYKLTTIIIMFLSVCISLDIGISYIVSLEEVDRDLQTNKLSLLKQLLKNNRLLKKGRVPVRAAELPLQRAAKKQILRKIH